MAGSQGPLTRPSAAPLQGLLSLVGRVHVVDDVGIVDGVEAAGAAAAERVAILAMETG